MFVLSARYRALLRSRLRWFLRARDLRASNLALRAALDRAAGDLGAAQTELARLHAAAGAETAVGEAATLRRPERELRRGGPVLSPETSAATERSDPSPLGPPRLPAAAAAPPRSLDLQHAERPRPRLLSPAQWRAHAEALGHLEAQRLAAESLKKELEKRP